MLFSKALSPRALANRSSRGCHATPSSPLPACKGEHDTIALRCIGSCPQACVIELGQGSDPYLPSVVLPVDGARQLRGASQQLRSGWRHKRGRKKRNLQFQDV